MKNLDLLVPTSNPDTDTWRWATITAVSPLRIRFDGDIDPLELTPDNTAGTLLVGDRVWTQITGKRVIVVSRATGPKFEAGDREPVGKVAMYAGDTPPTGYLLCDGGTFSSATYPELAALVADKFGVHSGTTYYLPDLRKRVPVGKDTSASPDTDFNVIGKTGGEKNHTLTNAEMPTHSHGGGTGYVSNDHTHGGNSRYVGNTTTGGGGMRLTDIMNVLGQTNAVAGWNTGGISANHWHGINNDGGGGAHNNMQPFVVLNYIIRAAA